MAKNSDGLLGFKGKWHLSNYWLSRSTCFWSWVIALVGFLSFVRNIGSSAKIATEALDVSDKLLLLYAGYNRGKAGTLRYSR